MVETVSLYDAKTHLSQLVERAAKGEEIVICKNGTPTARLMPLPSRGERRKPAGALGNVTIGPDFDAPLPDELLSEFGMRE